MLLVTFILTDATYGYVRVLAVFAALFEQKKIDGNLCVLYCS
jgi:hypothetical protein